MRTIRAEMRLRRVQVTGQPPRLGTCLRFSRVPISRSRAGWPRRSGPGDVPCGGGRARLPLLGAGVQAVEDLGHLTGEGGLAFAKETRCVVDQEQVAAQRNPSIIPSRVESIRRRSSTGQSQSFSSSPAACFEAAALLVRAAFRSSLRPAHHVIDAYLIDVCRWLRAKARSPPPVGSGRYRHRLPATIPHRGWQCF